MNQSRSCLFLFLGGGARLVLDASKVESESPNDVSLTNSRHPKENLVFAMFV